MDRAILVSLDLGLFDNIESLKELENLAHAANMTVIDKVIQKASKITSNFYIGSGKVQEIKKTIDILEIDIAIFDTELSPAQIRNLEKELDIQVIDRGFLILSIFAARASTKESRLEVDLAQQKYMLPRLVGLSSSLSRQGGGSFNAKGPGETKLELDRRRIESNILKLQEQIKKINKEKQTTTQRRATNEVPIVCLVGYTNAGKSATMNSLLSQLMKNEDKQVFEKNMLFATLSTSTRKVAYYNEPEFILTDTVGFVSRLPHDLVNSFKSTLSEVTNADLILHVIDGTNPNYKHQMDTTLEVLKSLSASEIPTINVLTKHDLVYSKNPITEFDYIEISNKTKYQYSEFIEQIYFALFGNKLEINLTLPYSKKSLVNDLYQSAEVISENYTEDSIMLSVKIRAKLINKYRPFIVK